MSDVIQIKAKELGFDEDSLVTITAHPGEKGIHLANEINERLGPVFLDLVSASTVENTEQAQTARQEAMASAVKGLYKIIPSGELLPLAKKILSNTKVTKESNGEKKVFNLAETADFNLYFQRNYKALIPLMRKVIEINGFLDVDISGLVLETAHEQPETTN